MVFVADLLTRYARLFFTDPCLSHHEAPNEGDVEQMHTAAEEKAQASIEAGRSI